MIKIRAFEEADWAATWQIIEPVFRAGETYAFSPDITANATAIVCRSAGILFLNKGIVPSGISVRLSLQNRVNM